MADDVAAAMCTALGLHRADTLGQIAQTLRAGPVNRVEVQRRAEVQLVDLVYLPGTVEPAPPQPGRN